MITLRTRSAVAVQVTALLFTVTFVFAAVPDYKLGDIATEEVVTPVQLLVVNPEATEALRQKVAQQVPFIIRRTEPSTAEAEAELRASVAETRRAFLAALQQALNGRVPVASDVDSAAYATTLREAGRAAPKHFPLGRFAPLWVRGASDDPLVANLIQSIREVMAQPVVADKAETPLPTDQTLRLIQVETAIDSPSLRELETAGVSITAGKVISLGRARRVVESYYAASEGTMGRFAATFVRPNAFPAPGLSEILRAKRMEGVTVNDTYEAAQVIVKKGQMIDRKALSALAAAREKSMIGSLQTKLDQEQALAGQITRQTKWIVAGLGAMCLVLVLIFWRLRGRTSQALVPVTAGYQSLPGSGQPTLPGGTGDDHWRDRAMVAEVKAARAHEAIRRGALGWMRDKIFQTIFHQRAELLSVQQKAEAEMRELEQRLEQLHTPLQERILAYEKRIEQLEQDLAAKGEENRELIGARIHVAKQQLNAERGRFGSN